MREGTKKTIDEKQYEIWHVPPMEAASIIMKLTKLLLEPLGKAIGKHNISDLLNADIDYGEALATLGTRLDEKELQHIMRVMFKYTTIQTDTGGFIPVDIDRDFQGEPLHMFNVLKVALEVNFRKFFFANS